MRAAAPAERRISVRQVTLFSQLVLSYIEHDGPAEPRIVAGASELVENGPCATGPIALVIVRGAIDGQATNLSLNFALGSTGSENAAMAKFSANLAAKITS